ncbi:MAG: FtsX-like permease family protein [bacterium]
MRSITALRMLMHDRATTAGSVLGVVAIIFLVGQQLSILFGLLNYMSVLVDHTPADIWVCTANTENVNSGGTLPMRYVDRVRGIEEVEWAEALVRTGGLYRLDDGRFAGLQVVGLSRPELLGGPWRFHEGAVNALLDFDAITVDRMDLDVLGYPEIGSVSEVNRQRVAVGAITQSIRGFEGTVVFTNIDKARQIGNIPADRCSNIMVKLKAGVDARQALSVVGDALPNTAVFLSGQLSRSTRAYYLSNTGIGGSIGFSTIVGTLVGIVIITLTMYTTVLNRQKDFAVLRALGARSRDIAITILFQGLIIAAVGSVLGFFLLALFLYGTMDSSLPTYMPLWVPPVHAGFTVVLCLLASVLSMRRATRIEPATAFR